MPHAKVRHFPKPYPLPDDPEPDPPALSVGLPHYRDEKLIEVFAFRIPCGTREWIHRRALQLEMSDGHYLYSLMERDATAQAEARKHCLHGASLKAHLDAEWSQAAADNHLNLLEKFRILRAAIEFIRWILAGHRPAKGAA